MHARANHRWDVSPDEAVEIQLELAQQVVIQDDLGRIRHVAGVDVGFEGQANKTSRAAVVVMRYPSLTPVDVAVARMPVAFPYVPGLLSFREIPVVLRAFDRLKVVPDVVLADGQGRAHPRRFGLASHLGLVIGLPTIGCAKSRLIGTAPEPRNEAGASSLLTDRGEVIGAVLRTRVNCKPLYVSVGHRINLARAIELVLGCCRGYRLPETTRYAHRAADGKAIPMDVDDAE